MEFSEKIIDKREELLDEYENLTLEEIAIQGKETFFKNGGKNFDVVPCLNDGDDHINLLKHLTEKYFVE